MRLNMLKKIDTFYIKETKKREFANELKVQLQECFDLKGLQKVLSNLFNKKLKYSVFEEKMSEVLNNK
jgi:uridine kinase